ncbi:methionine--tRNA ligase, putative [Plasmodium gallinaceum]|uniref:methionine--tRNA ligase n=1 Tax=Plasmodium gallinaceum TaxID=5849 RepID=A0A1J1GY27_PLAGA|nr:methionine--tRNA ligase, putative [Plasmodium gallinaceum]CRG97365.1 methionine--tRNA ligase, putative [Plasmodium gallinaceum]
MKLYPHKFFSETVKCMLAAHIYNFRVELCDDFIYTRTFDIEKNLLINKKPLLLYDNQFISSTKAICFFFHRLYNENRSLDEKIHSYLTWIEWSDLLEKYVELLNKKKIIESLDELESYLNENKSRSFICSNDGNSKISLADIFVYISLKHSNINICKESWVNISNYIEKINKLEDIQKIIRNVQELYKFKNIYSLFVSKLHHLDVNKYLKEEKFYITTAINYVNGDPHIGHAYEVVLADVIARYHRNIGRCTFFTSGSDEHGIKIANQAKKNNITPKELCDRNVLKFQKLNNILNISLDYYVRTTSNTHKDIVKNVWSICEKNGDIYLGEYEGWYNIREETYVPENEAKLMNYMDPLNNVKLEKMKEPSYFFKMSKYQEKLIKHINNNPHFIQPEQKRNEILQRLKEPLNDLSCSRTNFSWGISVPNDPKHVMYVWMDALLNYYSNCFIDKEKEMFWPADVHIIGKDITWFHSVIFPSILMSSNLELPKSIFSHGFVLAADGKKMSKSFGNVIDPFEIIETYGSDAFRFHVIKESKQGCDMRFDVDNLIDMCNSDLADTIGNLVQRTLSLCQSSNNSKIPPFFPEYNIDLPFNLLYFINRVEYHMKNFCVQKCCEKTVNVCKDLNKYLTDLAPWKYKQEENNKKLHIIRIMLESIYFIAHYLDIFVPSIASQIFKKLNSPKKKIVDLSPWLNNLKEGVIINNDNILFKKFEVVSAKIKMQKVIMRVCKITNIIKIEELNNVTICDLEIDQEKYIAALYLPYNKNFINTLTIALLNIKPIAINNYMVNAIIPHVNKEIFTFSLNENIPTGTLIQAKNYQTLVKQRDNLTKKEINTLNLSIIKNNCFFEKNIPLVFAFSDDKYLHHSTQNNGVVKFF